MQFHPLAYTVKLNIEMSMADLIAKIARSKDAKSNSSGNGGVFTRSDNRNSSGMRTIVDAEDNTRHPPPLDEEHGKGQGRPWATVTTTLEMHAMDVAPKTSNKSRAGFDDSDTESLVEAAAAYIEKGEVTRQSKSVAQ